MKTKRHYLMSAMNLIVAPEAEIVASFHGDKLYGGSLSGLTEWAKENDAGVCSLCTSDGQRHGLFPCLIADTPRMATALSVFSGYEVAVGDGRSFFTRKDARACYIALARAGVPVKPELLVWAITNVAYPEASPKTSSKPNVVEQPSVAQQHADCFL
jgi:hypothetical protein